MWNIIFFNVIFFQAWSLDTTNFICQLLLKSYLKRKEEKQEKVII